MGSTPRTLALGDIMHKIALEEHFLPSALIEYWEPTVAGMPRATYDLIKGRLQDTGAQRLDDMDAAGIDIAVLSVAGPGVQIEQTPEQAIRLARIANDDLVERIAASPERYAGFAHLPLQSPAGAADELDRCVRDLGFRGALINGQTLGHYLDEERFFPFWERVEALDVPVYLHPADPVKTYAALEGQKQLRRPTWEWTIETATHALRMVFNGTFERFPKAQLILGHMGETLPYLLWRLDSRALLYREPGDPRPLPSGYIRRNIPITISGVFANEPLTCALAALGEDRVMFAADYPFENTRVAGEFLDTAAIADEVRRKIAYSNAERLLRLSPGKS